MKSILYELMRARTGRASESSERIEVVLVLARVRDEFVLIVLAELHSKAAIGFTMALYATQRGVKNDGKPATKQFPHPPNPNLMMLRNHGRLTWLMYGPTY